MLDLQAAHISFKNIDVFFKKSVYYRKTNPYKLWLLLLVTLKKKIQVKCLKTFKKIPAGRGTYKKGK